MAQKYYAVRKGRQLGIYTDWSECEKQIKGFSGAEYKSFLTQEEAQNYINNTISTTSAESNNNTTLKATKGNNTVQIYVDGSYSESYNLASFGYIILKNDNEIYRHYDIVDNPNVIDMRNVAGELAGVMSALSWAKNNDITEVTIFYDYEGIEKWTTGEWKAKKENTILYKKFIENISNTIKIIFIKVKAHSGNKYNELADTLAKSALLEKNQINTTDHITNNQLSGNKEFSIIDNKNNINNLITFLQDTYKIERKEVQSGIQYIIKNDDEQFFITQYNNLRILFQGKPYRIYNDIIIFLSSIENSSDTIKKMNEEFYNFQSKDIDLKLYLPKSYNIFPDMLFSILQPSLLEEPTYILQDYSMYVFPALRALEGSIKYLLVSYGIKIDNKSLNCFDGYKLKNNDKVKIQNNNNKLAEHIEKMYMYYKNKRHPLFHTTPTLCDIEIKDNYEDVKEMIREVLELLDEAFDLHNSNG